MRNFNSKKTVRVLMVTLSFLLISGIIYAFSSGITGRTMRGPDPGCTCHGGSPTPGVNVQIIGPDSVVVNQTAMYTVNITGGPLVRAGTDIAVARGTLDTVGTALQNIGGELTHVAPLLPSVGVVSVPFEYTAPSFTGIDTIYAIGISVNFNNASSGDMWNFAPNKIIRVVPSVGIKNISSIATDYSLNQNYPNPFNPSTIITFNVAKSGNVKLVVMDMLGKEITTLVNQNLNNGSYEVEFDGTGFSSGIYFYKMTTKDFTDVKKMLLVK